MATPVKNIEKEFLLKVLYDEDLPAIYLKNRVEYLLFLKEPAKENLLFKAARPVQDLKARDEIDLVFDYRGKAVSFSTEVLHIKDLEITCAMPEFLYKNLDRSYSRVSIPSQMQIQFSVSGEHYELSFPKVTDYEDLEDVMHQNNNPHNLSGLIEQMGVWIKNYASGHRMVLFKDAKPHAVEERILAATGKTLFLPSTREDFPKNDPFPRKRIITGDFFKRYLESTGTGADTIDNACLRFIREKADKGILSDAWIPILFHQYVIGYVHIWNETAGKKPFDFPMIDTLYQFTKVLAYSLKIHGFFEKGKKDNTFEGKMIDISASGLLFAYPPSDLSSVLHLGNKLKVKIITPQRAIETSAVIVRDFKDKSLNYYGCQFEKIEAENLNYLFEYIYGKPLADFDTKLITGQV